MPVTPIVELLADIRDLLGSDCAALWRVDETATKVTLVTYTSADGKAPTLVAKQEGIVLWTAQQGHGEVSSDGDPTHFVATSVASLVAQPSVLSVGAAHGVQMPRDQFRHWMPRFAARLASLSDLLTTQIKASRTERQTAILLDTAARLHEHRGVELLGQEICRAVTEMTGTKRAALVHWSSSVGRGEVAFATQGHLIAAGATVEGTSQVGAACSGDFPVFLDDASGRRDGFIIYGGSELQRQLGSLAIIPLHGTDGVIGALVVEGDTPNQIVAEDNQNIRLLGLLAAAALETVWEIEEINRRARTDALTGLANRQAFEERLSTIVIETDRFGGAASLIVIDIDHFKHVNDTYGHHVGDRVLQRVAAVLQGAVRVVDMCARYGGEEMAILLPQTMLLGACQLAERLRRKIFDSSIVIDGRKIPLTISLGVACYPDGARSRDELFAAADRALYSAKRAGRNRVISDVV